MPSLCPRIFGEFLKLSGVSARITLSQNALPDRFFLIRAHKYPLGDFGHRATASPTNIVESGRAYGYTGCIRTFRDWLHYRLKALGSTFTDRPSNDALRGVEQASIRAGIELRCFFCVADFHQLWQCNTIFYRRHFSEDGDSNLRWGLAADINTDRAV